MFKVVLKDGFEFPVSIVRRGYTRPNNPNNDIKSDILTIVIQGECCKDIADKDIDIINEIENRKDTEAFCNIKLYRDDELEKEYRKHSLLFKVSEMITDSETSVEITFEKLADNAQKPAEEKEG